MVLYGAEHLTERAQAYDLLERAARLHWGWDRLPEMAREERGKPYFPGAPQYHFNLSHSGPFALCALSDRPVGVDIQVVRPAWSPKLVDRSCTPEERSWLAALGDRPEDFAALWACKESVGKESGYGIPHPPSRLSVPLPGDGGPLRPGGAYLLGGRRLRVYAGRGWGGGQKGGGGAPPPPAPQGGGSPRRPRSFRRGELCSPADTIEVTI